MVESVEDIRDETKLVRVALTIASAFLTAKVLLSVIEYSF